MIQSLCCILVYLNCTWNVRHSNVHEASLPILNTQWIVRKLNKKFLCIRKYLGFISTILLYKAFIHKKVVTYRIISYKRTFHRTVKLAYRVLWGSHTKEFFQDCYWNNGVTWSKPVYIFCKLFKTKLTISDWLKLQRQSRVQSFN